MNGHKEQQSPAFFKMNNKYDYLDSAASNHNSSEELNLLLPSLNTPYAPKQKKVMLLSDFNSKLLLSSSLGEDNSKSTASSLNQKLKASVDTQQIKSQQDRSSSVRLPLTPQVTLAQFKSLLTAYEQQEILMWPEIFFAGSSTIDKIGSAKRRSGSDFHDVFNVLGTQCDQDSAAMYNSGYDDSRGDLYLTRHDHVAYRFEILTLLGNGSFGQVVKCYDHKTKTNIALKIIRNKRRFEKQGLVEVNVLNKLVAEDCDGNFNLVHVLDHFYFRGHLCFSFELLGTNLYEWIKSGNFRGVHAGVISRFATQILNCLSLLDRLKIIHCDLKPENVLLRDSRSVRPRHSDSNPSIIPADFNSSLPIYDIKVIDFGSSCFENERLYTYVQSRFYRSPEVILGLAYTTSIDMWSLACVLAELYTGYPLFPGENEAEQLACIMEVKGLPPSPLLTSGSRSRTFFDTNGMPKSLTNSKGKKRRPGSKTLNSLIKCPDSVFLQFLDKCLTWDPRLRMKPQEALSHPFILDGGLRHIHNSASNMEEKKISNPKEAPITKKSLYPAPPPTTSSSSSVYFKSTSEAASGINTSSSNNSHHNTTNYNHGLGSTNSSAYSKLASIKAKLPVVTSSWKSTFSRTANSNVGGVPALQKTESSSTLMNDTLPPIGLQNRSSKKFSLNNPQWR